MLAEWLRRPLANMKRDVLRPLTSLVSDLLGQLSNGSISVKIKEEKNRLHALSMLGKFYMAHISFLASFHITMTNRAHLEFFPLTMDLEEHFRVFKNKLLKP